MSKVYNLVNPYIEGSVNNVFKSNTSTEASTHFYKSLSEHFNNPVPQFHFTLQKGTSGKGKYYHYKVIETKNNDNSENSEVQYKISKYEIENESAAVELFQNKLNNFKSKYYHKGGKDKKKSKKKKDKDKKKKSKKKKDSSSSDSSSSDSSDLVLSNTDYYKYTRSYVPTTQPIYYWWYDPYIYNLKSLYIPTFYSYVTPYIELSLSLN
jgi:hypothetical protein